MSAAVPSFEWREQDGLVLVWGDLTAGLTVNQGQRLARELSRALIASGVMRRSVRSPGKCTLRKRNYRTENEARVAHEKAGWRVQVYRCNECDAFHVANADKGAAKGSDGAAL